MISIVHFSDLHLSSQNNHLLKFTSQIVSLIRNEVVGTDKLFFIISGDIAYSGLSEEYELAFSFFSELYEGLKKLSPVFLFVPGNHDCNFKNSSQMRQIFLGNESNLSLPLLDTTLQDLTFVQKDFFDFCEVLSSPVVKGISILPFKIQDSKINFFLINSAMFSTLNETKDSTKINPPLLKEKINELKDNYGKDVFNIAVLHHPIYWNNPEVYADIKKDIEENVCMIFCGHEHSEETYEKKIDSDSCINYFCGDVLSTNNVLGGFSIIKLDLNEKTYKKVVCKYENENFTAFPDEKNYTFHKVKSPLSPKDDFISKLNENNLLTQSQTELSLQSLYVPLRLRALFRAKNESGTTEDNIINSSDLILNSLKENLILIKGEDKSGKTSLLKQIALSRIKSDKVAIYIDFKDIKNYAIKDLNRFLEAKFKEEYNGNLSLYQTLPLEKKTLLIDNIDTSLSVKDLLPILNQINNYAMEVILTSSMEFEETLNLLSSDEGLLFDKKYKVYQILPCSHEDRVNLIEKWLLHTHKEVSPQLLDSIDSEFLTLFKKQLMPDTPFFILSALSIMQMKGNLSGIVAQTSQAEFYRTLINNSLVANGFVGNHALEDVHSFLEFIAIEIFRSDIKIITNSGFVHLKEKFLLEKGLPEIPCSIEQLLKAGIFTTIGDGFKFLFDYVYYFFVAAYLSHNLDNASDITDDIKGMFENLYKKDNANILVFLSYHTQNFKIIDCLVEKSKKIQEMFPKTTEYSWNNPSFVDTLIERLPEITVSDKHGVAFKKEEVRSRCDEPEEKDSDCSDKIVEVLKLAEIIGTLLKNHASQLEAERKKILAKQVYLLHKSVVEYFISILLTSKDKLLDYLETKLNDSQKDLDKEQIKSEIRYLLFYLCALMYVNAVSHITNTLADSRLFPIDSALKNDSDLSGTFMNILLFGNNLKISEKFPIKNLDELLKEFEENKMNFFKFIVKLLSTRYISLNYENIKYSERQSLYSKLEISEKNQKRLLINSTKK